MQYIREEAFSIDRGGRRNVRSMMVVISDEDLPNVEGIKLEAKLVSKYDLAEKPFHSERKT